VNPHFLVVVVQRAPSEGSELQPDVAVAARPVPPIDESCVEQAKVPVAGRGQVRPGADADVAAATPHKGSDVLPATFAKRLPPPGATTHPA
jgi:hypothetical protein